MGSQEMRHVDVYVVKGSPKAEESRVNHDGSALCRVDAVAATLTPKEVGEPMVELGLTLFCKRFTTGAFCVGPMR